MANKKLKEKLMRKKKELESKGNRGNILFLKEGTIRARILPVQGEDSEFVREAVQFYFGKDLGGIFSQVSLGNECPIMDKYKELSGSSDEDDKELAKSMKPRRKYLIPCVVYTTEKGKEIDEERGITFIQITKGIYQDLIDKWLDEDEWGDMTDPINGYDIKFTRKGTGQFDTEYSMTPCKNSKLKKKYAKPVDLDEMFNKLIPSPEEAQDKLNQFLQIDTDDDDEDEKPKKKKKSTKKKKPLKKKPLKKKKGDLD